MPTEKVTPRDRVRARLQAHRHERVVHSALRRLAGDGYRILHGVSTPSGALDHVAVGPGGVFAIHVKGSAGKAYAKVAGNGAPKRVWAEAAEVRWRLEQSGDTIWVQPVVVCGSSRLGRGAVRHDAVTIVAAEGLYDYIQAKRSYLTDVQVERAAAVVAEQLAPMGYSIA